MTLSKNWKLSFALLALGLGATTSRAAAGQATRTRSFTGGFGAVRAASAVRAAANLRSRQPGLRTVATAALCAGALTTQSHTSSDRGRPTCERIWWAPYGALPST